MGYEGGEGGYRPIDMRSFPTFLRETSPSDFVCLQHSQAYIADVRQKRFDEPGIYWVAADYSVGYAEGRADAPKEAFKGEAQSSMMVVRVRRRGTVDDAGVKWVGQRERPGAGTGEPGMLLVGAKAACRVGETIQFAAHIFSGNRRIDRLLSPEDIVCIRAFRVNPADETPDHKADIAQLVKDQVMDVSYQELPTVDVSSGDQYVVGGVYSRRELCVAFDDPGEYDVCAWYSVKLPRDEAEAEPDPSTAPWEGLLISGSVRISVQK